MTRIQALGAIAFVSSLLSASAFAAEKTGTDVRFQMTGDAFDLTVTQTFDARVSIEQARAALTDAGLLPQVSNLVVGMERTPKVEPGHFTLRSSASKFGITRTTVNNCVEVQSPILWKQNCSLEPSNSTNSMLFVGGQGQSSLTCSMNMSNQVVCVSRVQARPKSLHYIIYNRTSQQLAAAGAVETTHDLGAILNYANGVSISPQRAKAAYESSAMAGLMQRAYDAIVGASSAISSGKTFTVKASDRTGQFSAGIGG